MLPFVDQYMDGSSADRAESMGRITWRLLLLSLKGMSGREWMDVASGISWTTTNG